MSTVVSVGFFLGIFYAQNTPLVLVYPVDYKFVGVSISRFEYAHICYVCGQLPDCYGVAMIIFVCSCKDLPTGANIHLVRTERRRTEAYNGKIGTVLNRREFCEAYKTFRTVPYIIRNLFKGLEFVPK